MYSLGALRSPKDQLVMAAVHVPRSIAGNPQTLDLRSNMQPVRHQGNQGSCVAFAASCIIEYFAKKSRNVSLNFAPQFIYNCRANSTEGMNPADCMKILHELGCPYERTYPYGKVEPKSSIPQAVFTEARGWTSLSSALVTNIESLKSALVTNGPCLVTFPTYNFGSRFWYKNPGEAFLGGHAVAIVGYTNTSFIIRNSWGDDWGNGGFTEYMFSEWGAHWEIWTVVDNEDNHPRDIPNDNQGCKCCTLL